MVHAADDDFSASFAAAAVAVAAITLRQDDIDRSNIRSEILDRRQPAGSELGHARVTPVLHEECVVIPLHVGGKLGEEDGPVGVEAVAPALDEGAGDLLVFVFCGGGGGGFRFGVWV